MRSIRKLVAVVAATALLAVVIPTVSAAASVRDFHLDKTCAEDLTEPLGYVCTVQHSDFKWMPPGTEVHYLSQADNVVQAAIAIRNGSTSGACIWSTDVNAVCTFHPGAGRLAQFHLRVDVTANADQSIWYWDGTYWFGG